MARQLQEQLYGSFVGVRHRGSFLPISEVYGVVGSKNFFHPGPDAITGIPGYVQHNNILPSPVRQIIPFRFQEISDSQELLAVSGDSIYRIDVYTSNVTLIGTGLTEGNDHDVIDFAVAGSQVFVASGASNAVHVYDGETQGWAPITSDQAPAPTVAVGAAGLCSGVYYVKYTYAFDDGTESLGSIASVWTAVEDAALDISGITVYAGPKTCIGRNIWVTAGDNANFFFYSGSIPDNVGTTYTHDIKDGTHRLANDLKMMGDPPPVGFRYCAYADNRLVLANREGERNTLYVSDVNELTSFWHLNTVEVNPGDGDEIHAVIDASYRAGEDARVLLVNVFKEWSIWNVMHGGSVFDFDTVQIEKTRSAVGTVSHNTILEANVGDETVLVFLAPDYTIRAFNGSDSVDISEPVRDYLNVMNLEWAHLSWGTFSPRLDMLFWQFPIGNSVVPNFGLGYHIETGAWVPFPDWASQRCGNFFVADNDIERQFTGAAVGNGGTYPIYEQFKGTTFNGAPINWIWRSKPLRTETGETSTYEYIEPVAVQKPGGSVAVKMWAGFRDPDTQPPHLDAVMSTADPDRSHVHETIPIQNATGDFIVEQEATAQIEETTLIEPQEILGFRLGYRVKRKKRFGR